MHLPTRYIGKEGEGSGKLLTTAVTDLYRPLGINVAALSNPDWVDGGFSDQWKFAQQGETRVFSRPDGASLEIGMIMPDAVPCVLWHSMPTIHVVFQG